MRKSTWSKTSCSATTATISDLLKLGLEQYSGTDAGMFFSEMSFFARSRKFPAQPRPRQGQAHRAAHDRDRGHAGGPDEYGLPAPLRRDPRGRHRGSTRDQGENHPLRFLLRVRWPARRLRRPLAQRHASQVLADEEGPLGGVWGCGLLIVVPVREYEEYVKRNVLCADHTDEPEYRRRQYNEFRKAMPFSARSRISSATPGKNPRGQMPVFPPLLQRFRADS